MCVLWLLAGKRPLDLARKRNSNPQPSDLQLESPTPRVGINEILHRQGYVHANDARVLPGRHWCPRALPGTKSECASTHKLFAINAVTFFLKFSGLQVLYGSTYKLQEHGARNLSPTFNRNGVTISRQSSALFDSS